MMTDDLLTQHPAVMAWQASGGEADSVRGVEVLKPSHRKSSVFRLLGAGLNDVPVVAKRCRRDSGLVEKAVYDRVLPTVPAPRLRCLGSTEDADPAFLWLFVEDAGAGEYSSSSETHRTLAGRWLGLVHVWADAGVVPLPDRGPDCYLDVVRRAASTIERNMSNPALTVDQLATLSHLVMMCAQMERSWDAIEALAGTTPPTLVHGGIAGKNLRVAERAGQSALLVFDWEFAGRGLPAADLSMVDLDAYVETVRTQGSPVDPDTVARIAALGTGLWCLYVIPPEDSSLASPWVDHVMEKMVVYENRLTRVLARPPWER